MRYWRAIIGPRLPADDDFAIRRVIASRDGLPGAEVCLVPHRNPGTDRAKVFLCHVPAG